MGSIKPGTGVAISPGKLLICAFVFFVCVTASNGWLDLLILTTAFLLASIAFVKHDGHYAKAIKASWLLFLTAAVIHLIIRLWFVRKVDISTANALLSTAFFLVRLLLLILMTALLLRKFSPVQYSDSVTSRLGFLIGKRNAVQAGHITMLAFSVLPQVQEHMANRKLARKLRGLTVSNDTVGRLEYARSELFAAFNFALSYAGVLAAVLWSRGFDPERSSIAPQKFAASTAGNLVIIVFCILCLTTLLPLPIN